MSGIKDYLRISLSQIILETGIIIDKKGAEILLNKTHLTPFTRHKTLLPIDGITSKINKNSKIAITSSLIARVELSENVIIGSNSNLIANTLPIRIGENSIIGDLVTISSKLLLNNSPGSVNIGENCIIGDKAVLKSCIIDDDCYIGEGSVIMEGAIIEKGVRVLPWSVVPPGAVLSEGYVWGGNAVEIIREFEEKDSKEVDNVRNNMKGFYDNCDQENMFYSF